MSRLGYAIFGWWLQQAVSIRITTAALLGVTLTSIMAIIAGRNEYYEFATIMTSLAIIAAGSMVCAGIVSLFTARNFWFRR